MKVPKVIVYFIVAMFGGIVGGLCTRCMFTPTGSAVVSTEDSRDNADTIDDDADTIDDDASSGPLTPEQIKKDLAEADSILHNSDEHLSFSEVERLYNKICQSDKSAEYNSADAAVFARVKDYGEAVQAIKGLDFNKIKELSERKHKPYNDPNKLHMWPQHIKCIEKIQLGCPSRGINSYKPYQRAKAQNFVREHVSELTMFSDLNRIDSLFTGAETPHKLGGSQWQPQQTQRPRQQQQPVPPAQSSRRGER